MSGVRLDPRSRATQLDPQDPAKQRLESTGAPAVEALTALDATLDAAAAIADGPLAEAGASRARDQALRRAGVVLCATAWEIYVGDSLSWVAAPSWSVRR